MNRAKLRALPALALLFPIDCVVACAILITDLASVPLRLLRRPPRHIQSPEPSSVTIQILNWDGKHLLEACLPSVVDAAGPHEIVVVDNGSADGSVEFLRSRFPQVRIVQLDRNYGFAIGNNRGLDHVRTDIVVLLNNDMSVAPDFLHPLLGPFIDPSVFAVTSQISFADSTKCREETGKTRGRFERGFFRLWHDDIHPEEEVAPAVPVLWAGGGSCAIDLRKLVALGRLDTLYHPFYVEDADISYQAWKRGWRCLLAPQSRVVHMHRATSRRKFGDDFVDSTIRRNQYLFIWKNVTDVGMILQHLLQLPRIHGSAILQKGLGFELRSYTRAVVRLPFAMWRRVTNIPASLMSDRDVLKFSQ